MCHVMYNAFMMNYNMIIPDVLYEHTVSGNLHNMSTQQLCNISLLLVRAVPVTLFFREGWYLLVELASLPTERGS